MLINNPPQTALEIQLVSFYIKSIIKIYVSIIFYQMIDEGEERLTQEQVDEILQIINEYFPQPEPAAEAME